MPTIVTFQGSYAFRTQEDGSQGEGQVYDTNTHRWEEPDVGEKEQLLGFAEGTTRAEGVSAKQRAERLGKCMEGNTMRWSEALWGASMSS